ncbi:DNA primase/helicase [Mycobacterium phage Lephleur]|uniref:DNA primase/helicase n=1 Tax=Mycobacterium phage Lephleur TaxID=2686234 RepID=A0A6B9L5N8_9CAUD|nr:DNA primase/helicase [Mycobacterium phage Lephleur]
MLGASDLQSILGVPPGMNTDPERMRAFIREACKVGLHLLLVYPNSKHPADMRTERVKNAADADAKEAARLAGRTDWARVKSPSGLALASNDPKVVLKYLDEYLRVFGTWHDADGNVVRPKGPKQVKESTLVECPPINLAIEVGASRLVVVDCDTKAQLDRFLAWSQAPATLPPTVRTPGQIVDGVPVHSDGGHFYFRVPDGVELPSNLGAITMSGDDGFAILWNRRYVLIPPSSRPEGPYVMAGEDYELIPALLEEITRAGALRAERAAEFERRAAERVPGALDTVIAEWAESTPWSVLLEPLGWTPASRNDACGCEVWTAGEGHASPKSATAHTAGCTLGRYTPDAPLHIWTDNPGEPFDSWIAANGTKTMSKLQVVALTEYGGNIGKAMDSLGLIPSAPTMAADGSILDGKATEREAGVDTANMDAPLWGDVPTPGPAPTDWPTEQAAAAAAEPAPYCPVCETGDGTFQADADGDLWHLPVGGDVGDEHLAEPAEAEPAPVADLFSGVGPGQQGTDAPAPATPPADVPFGDEAGPADPHVLNSATFGVPVIAPFAHWRDMPPPEYIIDGLLENGGLSCIIGPPGVGKSSVALDMACHIATGKRWQGRRTLKTKVLYMPGEGLSGAVQRIWAWEEAHGTEVGNDLLLANSIVKLGAQAEVWQEVGNYIIREGIGFIIFDTFARMALSVEENSATEVGKAVERFDQIRRHTNAGVLIVHHTGKHSETARGSSALNGALDSELLVREGRWDVRMVADDNGRLPGKAIELDTTKQKNSEQLAEPLPLMMVNWEPRNAPIITGPTGTVDPMQGDIVLARPTPEPVVETAIRMRRLIAQRFPEQGLTRTELVTYLEMDAYTASRADATKAWKQKVAEAADRGLRYDLIQTLTGTASGSRYVPSGGSDEQARQLFAAENILAD